VTSLDDLSAPCRLPRRISFPATQLKASRMRGDPVDHLASAVTAPCWPCDAAPGPLHPRADGHCPSIRPAQHGDDQDDRSHGQDPGGKNEESVQQLTGNTLRDLAGVRHQGQCGDHIALGAASDHLGTGLPGDKETCCAVHVTICQAPQRPEWLRKLRRHRQRPCTLPPVLTERTGRSASGFLSARRRPRVLSFPAGIYALPLTGRRSGTCS